MSVRVSGEAAMGGREGRGCSSAREHALLSGPGGDEGGSRRVADEEAAVDARETDRVDAQVAGFITGGLMWTVPMILIGGSISLLILFLVNRRKFSDAKKALSTPYGEMRLSRLGWLTEFGVVPLIIVLMMDNPNALWGDAVYPVVDQNT